MSDILVRQSDWGYPSHEGTSDSLGVRMKSTGLPFGVVLCLCTLLAASQQGRTNGISMSTLPAAQRSAIVAAIDRWNRQFKWKTPDNSDKLVTDTLVDTVHLGPPGEDDLVVTDRSECSPTGNCTILVLRPFKDRYRVILDGIGQSFSLQRSKVNGFRDVVLKMHGSATETTIKIYEFNGSRYLRAACYDENTTLLDADGNVQELEKPRITPCR